MEYAPLLSTVATLTTFPGPVSVTLAPGTTAPDSSATCPPKVAVCAYAPKVHKRSVINIFVIRNGLRWRDAPKEYGPHKTIYNRFIRWSRLGVFNKIFATLAARGGKPDRLMIDATHLKAHRTAASLLKKGLFPDVSGAPRAA